MFSFAGTGCKKEPAKRLSAAQIHQITQELAKAAADAAPGGSVIKTRRARGASAGAASDDVYVGLRGGDAAARVQQSIERVAGSHGLTLDPETRKNFKHMLRNTAEAASHATRSFDSFGSFSSQMQEVGSELKENPSILIRGKEPPPPGPGE